MSLHPSLRLPLGFRHAVLASLALAAACSDSSTPTTPTGTARGGAGAPVAAAPAREDQHPRLERLAQRVATALRDPAFRAEVHGALERSPVIEHKLHFQRFLEADSGRLARTVARLSGTPAAELSAELAAAPPLEMYLPVPAHRAAWRGGEELLVATAIADADVPVAFDLAGVRRTLDQRTPPATPVLAIEPVEIDFDHPPLRGPAGAMCTPDTCDGGGGGGGGGGPTLPSGLYMTRSHLVETFESWLKGSPEIEILVLGQKGATDSLTKYQCIGERSGAPYNFDQNGVDWTGSVLLFSQTQLDNYKAQHAGQSVRLFFMEDDDTSCEIKTSATTLQKLLKDVDGITRGQSGGRDSTITLLNKVYKYAKTLQQLYTAVASLINSNDDLIGNAVESATIGEYYTGYNWVLKGDAGQTNGSIALEMR